MNHVFVINETYKNVINNNQRKLINENIIMVYHEAYLYPPAKS